MRRSSLVGKSFTERKPVASVALAQRSDKQTPQGLDTSISYDCA
jgi:hypothetical protein